MMRNSPTSTRMMIAEVAAQLADINARIEKVLSNLDEAQPGYPATVSGASSFGGSGDGETSTATERSALSRDDAKNALARIHALTAALRVPTVELYSLARQWSYETKVPKLDLKTNSEWCDSCLRMQRCEPRYKSRWCSFCSAFRAEFGRLPSIALLDRHHRGMRITAEQRMRDRPSAR